MIAPGQIIDVWAVVQKHNTGMEVFGVFPTERQAKGYLEELYREGTSLLRVDHSKAFRPGDEPRVLLIDVKSSFYQLEVDYEPDADRIRRELRQSAWNKLTPEERNALNLTSEEILKLKEP